VVVLAGSNIDPERCVPEAVRYLRRRTDLSVVAVSDCYQTAAVGSPDDAPDFVNAAIQISTELGPEDLRNALHSIEDQLGRVRTEDKNAPRTIDLDIVFYGDLVKDFDGWSLPDPDMVVHPHVAVPVAEVVPDWAHPVSGRSAKEIAEALIDDDPSISPAKVMELSPPYVRRTVDFDDDREVYSPRLESLVRDQLIEIGEDPDREGLLRTPLRVAKHDIS
jgi:2-amino-4-hydroxy-6-hydroxymethyldihydropteridine diphosphokinase